MQNTAKFQNNRWKTERGVVTTRYPLSIHFDSISYKKRDYAHNAEKVRKNNQSNIPKPYAHLHSMLKTSAKFQNNEKKTLRGVVPTRYPLSIHFKAFHVKQETKFTKQKKCSKNYQSIMPKPHAHPQQKK